MPPTALPRAPIAGLRTVELGPKDEPLLQRFFEANPACFLAQWFRLGVVHRNARAERFLQSLAFVQTRTRIDVEMGRLVNTLRVMFKPLAGGTLAEHLTLVERDRAEVMRCCYRSTRSLKETTACSITSVLASATTRPARRFSS
jgi:hypothetical protein